MCASESTPHLLSRSNRILLTVGTSTIIAVQFSLGAANCIAANKDPFVEQYLAALTALNYSAPWIYNRIYDHGVYAEILAGEPDDSIVANLDYTRIDLAPHSGLRNYLECTAMTVSRLYSVDRAAVTLGQIRKMLQSPFDRIPAREHSKIAWHALPSTSEQLSELEYIERAEALLSNDAALCVDLIFHPSQHVATVARRYWISNMAMVSQCADNDAVRRFYDYCLARGEFGYTLSYAVGRLSSREDKVALCHRAFQLLLQEQDDRVSNSIAIYANMYDAELRTCLFEALKQDSAESRFLATLEHVLRRQIGVGDVTVGRSHSGPE